MNEIANWNMWTIVVRYHHDDTRWHAWLTDHKPHVPVMFQWEQSAKEYFNTVSIAGHVAEAKIIQVSLVFDFEKELRAQP
jgi:hypothetical protein